MGGQGWVGWRGVWWVECGGVGLRKVAWGEEGPTKIRFPAENPESPGKMRVLGRGGLGIISIIILKKRFTRKLHRIILLHLGLICFGLHFGKTENPRMFMVFGPSGRDTKIL